MKILVACEYSGRVRDAFRAKGHDAWSCDLLESESDSKYHIIGDALEIASEEWDLMIAHPPCTYLTNAGIRWLYHPEDTHLPWRKRRRHPDYPNRMQDLADGVRFFNALKGMKHIQKICIENSQPHGLATLLVGHYTQKVQPWMFGDPHTKGACLWLKGLPALVPTDVMSERKPSCHYTPPGPDRWKERSRTYHGIANAMAEQWG